MPNFPQPRANPMRSPEPNYSHFPQPRANLRRAWYVTFLTMISAVIFGLDMGTFGIAHGLPSFLAHWCSAGGYQTGADSCTGPHAPKNAVWIHQFVIPSVLLNLAAASVACMAITPAMLPRFGHRVTTNVSLGVVTAGCFLHTFVAAAIDPMHGGLALWFFGRFLLGLGIGLLFATMPQWNNELVTKEMRGQTGAILQVTNILGVLIGGLVTLSAKSGSVSWEIPTSLTGFFAVAMLVPVNRIPDSPVWLLKCHLQQSGAGGTTGGGGGGDMFEAAVSVLKTLRVWRGRDGEVSKYRRQLQESMAAWAGSAGRSDFRTNALGALDDEVWRRVFGGSGSASCADTAILEIEATMHIIDIRSSHPPACHEFFTNEPRGLLHRTLVALFVGGIGQNLAGMIALNNISFQLFTEVGMDKPFAHTAIFDCLQLAGAITGALCLDGLKWGGRRRNLLVGSAILTTCMIVVGSGLLRVQHIKNSGEPVPKSLQKLNFAVLLLYAFVFHATWAAAWVYPAEISYASERARIASFAMAAHFGGATLVVGVIALLFAWSQAGTMFLFAVGNGISFLVVNKFVVETKDQTIGDIVAQFKRHSHGHRRSALAEDDAVETGYVQMADR
jgi:MFS family permease